MGETTSGPRAVLARPAAYLSLQRLVGADRSHRRFAAEHLRARSGDRVLDIGCGPGHALDALPDVDYLGVDINAEYVRAAQERHGKSRFRCVDIRRDDLANEGPFDLVIAMGLLHHLDDDAVRGLIRTIGILLRSGGRFVSIDPVFLEGQPRIARWLIRLDRGQDVRSPEAMLALVDEGLPGATVTTRNDLLRVPYTHAIVEAEAR